MIYFHKINVCDLHVERKKSLNSRIIPIIQKPIKFLKFRGDNSYKLKEKINLESVWISSNNCTHSFVIGWPKNSIRNYIAQFR